MVWGFFVFETDDRRSIEYFSDKNFTNQLIDVTSIEEHHVWSREVVYLQKSEGF